LFRTRVIKMSFLKQAVLEIVGALFNRTVQITKDGFIIVKGLVQEINGSQYKISTKYITGTTVAGALTNVPHGLTDATYILDVDGDIQNSAGYWGVKEFNRIPSVSNGYTLKYDDTNIIFDNVGTNFQGQPYKIAITYIVD